MRRRYWLIGIAGAVVLALGIGALGLERTVNPSGGPGAAVDVDIPAGTSTGGIVKLLAENDVVRNGSVFRLYLRANGKGAFEAGLYHLRKNLSMGAAVKALSKGPALPPAVSVTVPEGFTLEQVALRFANRDPQLRADAFLAAARDGSIKSRYSPPNQRSLEGLLFPDTYRVERRDNEATMVQRMVDTFDSVAQSLGYDDARTKVGRSAYETVIVASLVEAEAKSDVDRGKIARVIYNRLAQKMPLGIDAAFYYVLPLDRRGTPLRQSDLDRDTPYNTRLRAGLVPTPIDMPSKESLAAAINPEPGPWLYYVLKDKTTHAFSSDPQQFERDRAEAQRKGLL